MTAPNIAVLIPVLITVLLVSIVAIGTCFYCYRADICCGAGAVYDSEYDEEKSIDESGLSRQPQGEILRAEHENVADFAPAPRRPRPSVVRPPPSRFQSAEHVHINDADPEAEMLDIIDAHPE